MPVTAFLENIQDRGALTDRILAKYRGPEKLSATVKREIKEPNYQRRQIH
jgi:hypothetical protein